MKRILKKQRKWLKKKVIKNKERIFINKAKESFALKEFVKKQFVEAKCGNVEIQHTPLVTRIIIWTSTPGLVIGSGGERIREMTERLKKDFHLENPQIDVQKIYEPDMDPNIVAQNIASAIEANTNHKRLGNYYTQRIMRAGAIGCEIVIAGKLAGQRSKTARFTAGYLKKCGEPAMRDVIKGFAVANPKLGNIGIKVKIMIRHSDLFKTMGENHGDNQEKAAQTDEQQGNE